MKRIFEMSHDLYVNICMYVLIHYKRSEWKAKYMQLDKWTNKWKDRQIDEWINELIDRQMNG